MSHRSTPKRLVLAMAAVGTALLGAACGGSPAPPDPEPARTLPVTTLDASGAGSLSDGLANANDGDRVVFDPGLTGSVRLTAPIEVSESVQIEGPGGLRITVTTALGVTPFRILPGADVRITGIGILGVRNTDHVIDIDRAAVVLDRVAIRDCDVESAIRNRGGIVEMFDCTVLGCLGVQGSALRTEGGVTTVERCTFSGNVAEQNGGAVRHVGGTLRFVNCTLHGNIALGPAPHGIGGAIHSTDSPLESVTGLVLLHCTITQNEAGQRGGGIAVEYAAPSRLTVRGSVIAENLATFLAPDAMISNTTLSTRFNVIGVSDGFSFVDGIDDNRVGTPEMPLDPRLGPLLEAGGDTETRRPLAGSPTVNAIPPENCIDLDGSPLADDQRRFPRPFGTNCDIGSIER